MTTRRSARQRPAAGPDVPQWPRSTAILTEDGSGQLTLNGPPEDFTAADVDDARAIVIERVSTFAREHLGRPVRLLTTDPDGRQFQLAVHPDGHVAELASQPTGAPKPSAARRRRRGARAAHAPRFSTARASVLFAVLLVCGSVAAVVLSSHPVRSASHHSPITPRRSTAPPRPPAAHQQAKRRPVKPRQPRPLHRSPVRSHYRSPRSSHHRNSAPLSTPPSSPPTSAPASHHTVPAPAPAPAPASPPTPAPGAVNPPARSQPRGQFNF